MSRCVPRKNRKSRNANSKVTILKALKQASDTKIVEVKKEKDSSEISDCDSIGLKKSHKGDGRNNHEDKQHPKSKYECSTCLKRFTRPDSLRHHIQVRHDKVPYSCDVCGELLKDRHKLHWHKQTVHQGFEPKCPHCKIPCHDRNSYVNHKYNRICNSRKSHKSKIANRKVTKAKVHKEAGDAEMIEVKEEKDVNETFDGDDNGHKEDNLDSEVAEEVQAEPDIAQKKECSMELLNESSKEAGRSNVEVEATKEVLVVNKYYPNMGLWEILRAQRALKRAEIMRERELQNM